MSVRSRFDVALAAYTPGRNSILLQPGGGGSQSGVSPRTAHVFDPWLEARDRPHEFAAYLNGNYPVFGSAQQLFGCTAQDEARWRAPGAGREPIDIDGVARRFNGQWRKLMEVGYEGDRTVIQRELGASERTARQWLNEEMGCRGKHVVVALKRDRELALSLLVDEI